LRKNKIMLVRILKILTFLVIILMLGFLSMGLMVPQVDYESSAEVEGSVKDVFDLYNDMDKIDQWIPTIKSIKPLKETDSKIGSVYEMVIDNDGAEIKMKEKVLDYKDGELVALEFDAGVMRKTDVYTFAQAGNKTKIIGKHSVVGNNYFYKCMFSMFGSNMQKIDQKYMDAFIENFKKR